MDDRSTDAASVDDRADVGTRYRLATAPVELTFVERGDSGAAEAAKDRADLEALSRRRIGLA